MPNSGRTPPKPLPLARILDADARIAAWTARLREEAALTALVRRLLPRPLAERIRVTDTRHGILELAAAAGAAAAAVRQRTPEMIAVLRREGWNFTEIRIRVQVRFATSAERKILPRHMDTGSDRLFDLAGQLPDGALKRALDRWSRRARGRTS